MSGIPGSRVAGVGPTPPGEQPHHRACRTRTPEEAAGVSEAEAARRLKLSAADRLREAREFRAHERTCDDPTCYCDWSPT